MTRPAKAIFFDMDGTILDWQTGMDETWRVACEAHVRAPEGEIDALCGAIFERRTWFWSDRERSARGRMDLDGASRTIVEHALSDLGRDQRDVAHAIAADYRARRLAGIAPYPGAIETLEAFRARGVPMALITNGNGAAQRASVDRFGLARFFECIVIEGEFGCGKPDERVFRHALRATACDPAAAWMVGDNVEADIAPAMALGLHAVWVDIEGVGLPDGGEVRPHRTVRSIAELIADRDL